MIGLDFTNKALWKAMTDAMAYWVRAADIDGYRCDEPRVMPAAPAIVQVVVRMPAPLAMDSRSCGELVPPPVPPPEFSLS